MLQVAASWTVNVNSIITVYNSCIRFNTNTTRPNKLGRVVLVHCKKWRASVSTRAKGPTQRIYHNKYCYYYYIIILIILRCSSVVQPPFPLPAVLECTFFFNVIRLEEYGPLPMAPPLIVFPPPPVRCMVLNLTGRTRYLLLMWY